MSKRATSKLEIMMNKLTIRISQPVSILGAIALLGSTLAFVSTQSGKTKALLLHSSEVILHPLPAAAKEPMPSSPTDLAAQRPNSPVSENIHVVMAEELLSQLPATPKKAVPNNTPSKPVASSPSSKPTPPRPASFLAQVSPQLLRQGTKLSLNGRTLNVAWRQWQLGTSVRTGISDVGLMHSLGMELLSTQDWNRQPVQWFSDPLKTPLILASHLAGAYRYLDVSDFAKIAGLGLQAEGETLKIVSAPAKLKNIQPIKMPWGSRIIVDLNRPIPWQISDRRTEGVITLDAIADSALIERFAPPPLPPPEQIQEAEDAAPVPVVTPSEQPLIRVENGQNQTTLRVPIPEGQRLQVFTVPNPNRLVIEVRPDAWSEKEILWARGVHWRQRYVNLGESRFPVVWLEVDPKANRMSFRPIWGNRTSQMGTVPLIQMAQSWQASAAINAGFFNRNNQLPLGAIRREGRWFSGPILNRGAIAWNDQGQFKIGRLTLQEILTTSAGMRLPIVYLNSAYVHPGISRYTPEWGATYTPLSDNEILIFVQNNQVIAQTPGGRVAETAFPIPANGYLLTLRDEGTSAASWLDVGTQISLDGTTLPTDFANYPHILGAGPVLVQNGQIVLDAKAEQFSDAFNQQMAVRSAIGTTATGTLMIAAFHNRVGGRGPSLAETAQLMQQMGAVDALNLDGGSSTGLYLGGQLLDRSAYTAARVHNALGLFLSPIP
jgi:hypothetical protein